jgi:hypothetical protein
LVHSGNVASAPDVNWSSHFPLRAQSSDIQPCNGFLLTDSFDNLSASAMTSSPFSPRSTSIDAKLCAPKVPFRVTRHENVYQRWVESRAIKRVSM